MASESAIKSFADLLVRAEKALRLLGIDASELILFIIKSEILTKTHYIRDSKTMQYMTETKYKSIMTGLMVKEGVECYRRNHYYFVPPNKRPCKFTSCLKSDLERYLLDKYNIFSFCCTVVNKHGHWCIDDASD